jgi:hypothetical protein
VSHIGLFAAGVFVSLLVAASMALLVWGAILDGRDETRERLRRERESLEARRRSRRPLPIDDGAPPRAA